MTATVKASMPRAFATNAAMPGIIVLHIWHGGDAPTVPTGQVVCALSFGRISTPTSRITSSWPAEGRGTSNNISLTPASMNCSATSMKALAEEKGVEAENLAETVVGPANLGWIASDLLALLVEPLTAFLKLLGGEHCVPDIGIAGDQAQHAVPASGDDDRHPAMHRFRFERRIVDLDVAPVEGRSLVLHQRIDDGERLRQPVDLLARGAEGEAVGGVFKFHPARSHTERRPPSADMVDRDSHLRGDDRMAQQIVGDEHPELDAFCHRRSRGEQRPAFEVGLAVAAFGVIPGHRLAGAGAGVGPPGQQVVGQPDTVVARSFNQLPAARQMFPAEKLVGAESDPEAVFHDWLPPAVTIVRRLF